MSEIVPTIFFNSSSSSGLETIASKNITVTLSEASGLDTKVDYALTGTATGSGNDYTLYKGSLRSTSYRVSHATNRG
jgi:hypothetical protein